MPISGPGIPTIPSWAYQPQTAATDPTTDPQNPPPVPLSEADTTCPQSTDSSNNVTVGAPDVTAQPNPTITSTPIGDPLVASAMKAQLDACKPLPAPSGLLEQLKDQSPSRIGMKIDHAIHCDQATAQLNQAQRESALDSRGLPIDPPKITQADIKAPVEAQTPAGSGNPATGITPGQVMDLTALGTGTVGAVADGIAQRAAAKATGATVTAAAEAVGLTGAGTVAVGASVVGGVMGAIAAFRLGADIRESLDAPGKQRDAAITRMQADMSLAAHDLINQKFHGGVPLLNEQGKQQATQTFNNWKAQTGGKLDSVLKDYQSLQGKNRIEGSDVLGQKLSEIEGVANQGVVDLANSLMNVYYDPRNWDESNSTSKVP